MQRAPRADQAPFIHGHDGVPVQPDRALADAIEQDRERFDVALVDTGGRQIVRLSPGERGPVDRPPLIAPRGNERLQGGCLPGTRRGDGQPEPPAKAEALDCCSLRLAMLPGKVQPGLFDLAAEQSLRQRRAPIGCRGLDELDELLLLALVQRGRDADGALARLLAPDQRGCLTVLPDTFLAHQFGDGHHVAGHVVRARFDQPARGGDMRRPVREHRLAGELVGQERQRHLVGAAKPLLVREFREGRPAQLE